jgi:hypothetical protein
VPDTLNGAEFLSLPDNSVGSAWAVQFAPSSLHNQLVEAEIYAILSSEASWPGLRRHFLPSGLYFYRVNISGNDGQDFVSTKKMLLMK